MKVNDTWWHDEEVKYNKAYILMLKFNEVKVKEQNNRIIMK